MADITPPNYETPLGMVRALISDTEQLDLDGNGTKRYRQSDGQLEGFIALSGDTRLNGASAQALYALAANEILIGKWIKTEDLATDGAKVGDALRLLAQRLDAKQKAEDDDKAFQENAFEIVNFGYPYTNLEN